jgi:hypothetical protein
MLVCSAAPLPSAARATGVFRGRTSQRTLDSPQARSRRATEHLQLVRRRAPIRCHLDAGLLRGSASLRGSHLGVLRGRTSQRTLDSPQARSRRATEHLPSVRRPTLIRCHLDADLLRGSGFLRDSRHGSVPRSIRGGQSIHTKREDAEPQSHGAPPVGPTANVDSMPSGC